MVAPRRRGRQRERGDVLGCGAVSQEPTGTTTPKDAEPFTTALERMNRFQEPEARTLIADLGLPRGSHGLDVGCGVGLYTLWLAEAVGPQGRVVGIEPSAERVEAARALAGGTLPAPRLEFREGDGTTLEFPDATLDWVWCGDVLHHIQETGRGLGEFARVLRPGGRVIVKESQLLPGLFLPGHPALERRLRQAEMEWSRHEGGQWSFEERRQRTLAFLHAAGLRVDGLRTYLLERRAPLADTARDYIRHVVFERNWGPRLRNLLAPADWKQRSALCEEDSTAFILDDPDYYCLYPISVLVARR